MKYNLVFEGGGAKGSVFVGAMQEFNARGHEPGRLIGTSAGAISATLLAAGYSPDEMLEAVNEKLPDGKPRFSTFMDIAEEFSDEDIKNSLTYELFRKVDIPFIPEMAEGFVDDRIFELLLQVDAYREIFSFVERGGLYAGEKFIEWLTEKLNAGNRNLGDKTLAEFHLQTGKDLAGVVSDTAGNEMRVLNHRTAPDCPVRWAVRMSMSIPFVWQEVRWQADWGPYLDEDITGNTIVDGGALSNFPIRMFTSTDASVVRIMGERDPGENPNLGLLIDDTLPVAGSGEAGDEQGDEGDPGSMLGNVKRLKTVRRIKRLVDTMMVAHDMLVMETHANEICRLPAKGYGTTEFDMSDARLQALINAGRQAMKDYFDRREGDS
jgi:predicted acylesterase/phospholipase RssA